MHCSYFLTGMCPYGFVPHKRRCYGFFVNSYDRTSYHAAQSRCRSYAGGELVSILSTDENEFVAKKVLEINPNLSTQDYYYPWIGLQIKQTRRKGNKCIRLFQAHRHKYKIIAVC